MLNYKTSHIFLLLIVLSILISGCAKSTETKTEPAAQPAPTPQPLPTPQPVPTPTPAPEPTLLPKCTDNDGDNIFEKGTVSVDDEKFEDECVIDDTSKVKEYICENDAVNTKVTDCPVKHACKNGKCIELVQKCEDSDKGKNAIEYGEVKIFGLVDATSKDVCSSETTLTEYYCEGAESKSENITCATDQICKEGKCMAKPDQFYTVEAGKIVKIMDKFDGNVIDKTRYATAKIGNGAIAQDNKIVMNGSAKDSITWTVLYTNDALDLKKRFTVIVDIDLKSIPPSDGDVMAIVGMEEKNVVSSAQQSGTYCELSIGNIGTILRTESNEPGKVGHGGSSSEHGSTTAHEDVDSPKGKMIVAYDPSFRTVTCTFNDKKISTDVKSTEGDYVLVLRSGVHKISNSGIESEGTGTYIATFDNLNLTR